MPRFGRKAILVGSPSMTWAKAVSETSKLRIVVKAYSKNESLKGSRFPRVTVGGAGGCRCIFGDA